MDRQGWLSKVPANTSGIEVRGDPAEFGHRLFSSEELIENALRPDGIVMLLPSQKLEGCGIYFDYPVHLNRRDIQNVILYENFVKQNPVDFDKAFSHGRFLTSGASNMSIHGSIAEY